MPGITGIIAPPSSPAPPEQIGVMVGRMRHDLLWHHGHTTFDQLGVAAGWVTRPGSFADGAPFWNEDRTVALFFADEEFASRERTEELQRLGHSGLADSAALLVHLYEEHGPAFIEQLNGWFSGLLVDLRQEKAILFNDRYGLGRIYLHESPAGLYFASEAKSLLAVLPGLREIDQRGLAEFYSVGCVLQNRSLFRDIRHLPQGSRWTFHRDGRIEKERYFHPETWEGQDPLDLESYSRQLEEVFARVAPRYLRGTEPVAMSLTGGLDSRMLLAWANAAPGTLPCYTFGGPYRDCADVKIARRLAAITGQTHTTIPVGEEFFPAFGELAEQTVYRSDGTMDVSGAVELHVNEKARGIAPVRLTGNYGSEILRSNVAFRPARLDRSIFTPEFSALLDEAEATYREEAAGNRLSLIAFKQVPWHHYGRLSVEQSVLTPRSPFLDNDLVQLAYRVPVEHATSPAPLLRLIAAGNPALDRIASDRALRHRSQPVLGRLAREWQEFTAKAEYAYDYGMPQKLVPIDHQLRALRLERLFLGRHKFYHFRIWYKERLAGYLKEQVSKVDHLTCYREGAARQMVGHHLSGRRNNTSQLHKLLSATLTARLLAT
jgi:asparagine synthase (glutamine-hydrolysing)